LKKRRKIMFEILERKTGRNCDIVQERQVKRLK